MNEHETKSNPITFDEPLPLNLMVKAMDNFYDFKRATYGDAGFDLYATEDGVIWPFQMKRIPVGIKTSFNPGWYMQICEKSGVSYKHGLRVLAGVMDCGYRGEWMILMKNSRVLPYPKPFFYKRGDKIAQAVPLRISTDDLTFVNQLPDSERGEGGFGSTGR
jgi:dUTP pyrophosphatase